MKGTAVQLGEARLVQKQRANAEPISATSIKSSLLAEGINVASHEALGNRLRSGA